MFTRLEVDGFKSLREFAVDLEPFTVLVGPNDAGKSNILEALALAARLGHTSPEEALKHGRGRASDQFWRHGSQSSSVISLAIESLESDTAGDDDAFSDTSLYASRLRYEIRLERVTRTRGTETVELKTSVRPILTSADTWLTAHPEWRSFVLDPIEPEREFQFLPFFRLMQLNASLLREPSERIDSGELAPDASNLPSVLAALSDLELGRIRATLVALIPGISDFDIVERDDNFHIEFKTREGEVVPARLASDGTLRMLGLLTAVIARPPGSWNTVVCIEEPENGIYPGRLTRLIEILRGATDAEPWRRDETDRPPPQILLTTHSPIALSSLQRHPESLRLVEPIRRDGMRFTRARRVVEEVTDRRTEASLREISLLLRTSSHEEAR